MKVSGRKISVMAMDMKYLKIIIAIEGSIWTINNTERVSLNGVMEKYMMESGFRAKKTVLEFGKDYLMTVIRGNGRITRPKDSVLIYGVMVTGMKENGLHL
jgi:hypothetical protein